MEAKNLKIGERVKTQEGKITLVSKEKVEGWHRVYNLEVYRDHSFLVSTDKILNGKHISLMKEFTRRNSLIQLKRFDLFENTLVLKFSYDNDEFTWEGIRANWTLERGQREFICLSFENVSDFKRIIPEKYNNKFKDVVSEFYAQNFSGTYESESSSIHKKNDRYRIEITLPYLLGKIIFSFDSVVLKSKIGIGEKVASNRWQYKDLETAVPFDFYRPFE